MEKPYTLGYVEIGVLRYYAQDMTLIDGLGLVTPDVIPHVAKREYDWYIRAYRPDYILVREPPRDPLELFTYTRWFHTAYRLVRVFDTGAGTFMSKATLYRLQDQAAVPSS